MKVPTPVTSNHGFESGDLNEISQLFPDRKALFNEKPISGEQRFKHDFQNYGISP
jgi:hypothetical protein